MSKFGELFPETYRESYSERSIVPGSVFRAFTKNTNPPKIKIFIILSVRNDLACVGSLFINSEININCFPTQPLQNLHLCLPENKFDFLDHDSFLDCSQIKEIELQSLYDQVKNDPGILIGALDKETLLSAIDIAKAAPTISPNLKSKFLQTSSLVDR